MNEFARKIISWQLRCGRHGLPWQDTRDPYRIWLSEIMLQQTQVTAVIPYFERFLERFPDIAALAQAEESDVMQMWAGLGYYARARNLHRAAKQIVADHQGRFPEEFDAIHGLPGIGRSTAAAIAAFAFSQRRAILDGNVKRVFARHFAVGGDVKSKAVETALWQLAEQQLPASGIEPYTQGLMDLGATVCRRSQPSCLLCPVKTTCVAFKGGRIDELPGKAARRVIPHRETRMLIVVSRDEVMLERRPPTGIWGGLWSLPEMPVEQAIDECLFQRYQLKARSMRDLPRVDHGFTHYTLTIFPVVIEVDPAGFRAMEPGAAWVGMADAHRSGVPAPVKRILAALASAGNDLQAIKC